MINKGEMIMELFIAEKPSVAKYLAQVISGGYEKRVTILKEKMAVFMAQPRGI